MKTKALVLAALSTATMLSADYNCPNGNCAYQGQGQNQGYRQPYSQGQGYQGQSYQGQNSGQQYYQDRNSQNYNQNQPYSQNNASGNNQHPNGQNQYNQNNNNNQDREGYYSPSPSNDRWNNANNNNNQRWNNANNNGNDRANSANNNENDRWNSANNFNNSAYENDRNAPRVTKAIPDEEIAKQVHNTISSGWLSSGYPDVTFDVNDGVINLRGFVKNQDEKSKLEKELRKIDGVKQVNNEISIGDVKSKEAYNSNNTNKNPLSYNESKIKKTESAYPQDSASTDSDHLINSKIRHKLKGWFSNDYETITLNTSNGVVTVTGFVTSVDDIQKISKDAKAIDGVKNVNNNVTVQKK